MTIEQLLEVHELTIAGRGVVGDGPELPVVNPASGEIIAQVRTASHRQAGDAIAAAHAAFQSGTWASASGAERGAVLERFAYALEEHRDAMLSTVVAELGTPVSLAGPVQVDSAIAHLRQFAALAPLDRVVDLGRSKSGRSASAVDYMPIGVVVAIPAYNYPLMITISKVGAALAAGCTVVVLAPPTVPLGVLALGRLAREASVPDGVVNVIVGADHEIPRTCAMDPRVAAVSFTGSVAVGKEVMRQAAEDLKRLTLELGGKSPDIVLPDFPLTFQSVRDLHYRYLRNAGQGCASPTRILVDVARMAQFEELSRAVFSQVPVGDPRDPATIVGPVITQLHRERVQGFVERAVAGGGRLVARGSNGPSVGYFVAPQLVGDVSPNSEIAQEEIFGPVGVLLGYEDIADAVRIANGTNFGLAAYVHGADQHLIDSVVRRLRAGTVTINGAAEYRLDAPFGGLGHSGFGREWGEHGVREFLVPRHLQWATPAS